MTQTHFPILFDLTAKIITIYGLLIGLIFGILIGIIIARLIGCGIHKESKAYKKWLKHRKEKKLYGKQNMLNNSYYFGYCNEYDHYHEDTDYYYEDDYEYT